MAQRLTSEAFIGSADVADGEPFDIHEARAELADELLQEHDALSERPRTKAPNTLREATGACYGNGLDQTSRL